MRTLRKKLRKHFTQSSLQRLIHFEDNFQLKLSKAMNEVLLTTLLIIGIQSDFIISEILLKQNLSLLFYSVVLLKMSQTGKRQKCLTTISILSL